MKLKTNILALLTIPTFFLGCSGGDPDTENTIENPENVSRIEKEVNENFSVSSEINREPDREKVSSEVIDFLNKAKLRSEFKEEKYSLGYRSESVIAHTYRDFSYDPERKKLIYSVFYTHKSTNLSDSSGVMGATFTLFEVDLEKAESPILINETKQPEIKQISFKAPARFKEISAESYADNYAQRTVDTLIDAELDKNVHLEPFNDERVIDIYFYITGPLIPRVNNALEDLLKVHGVKPSKY